MKTYTRTITIKAEPMTFEEYFFQTWGHGDHPNRGGDDIGWFVVAPGKTDRWIDDATFKSLDYKEKK